MPWNPTLEPAPGNGRVGSQEAGWLGSKLDLSPRELAGKTKKG
jgi:hypothetical protein